MKNNISDTFDRYLSWCKNDALPFWVENGIADDGGFWERLEKNGKPIKHVTKKFYVQCRQCLVFAEAANRNWHPSAKEIAIKALSFTIHRGGFNAITGSTFEGVPYSLTSTGEVEDPSADLYTFGFVLLALAQYIKLVDRKVGISCAEELMSFLDSHMASEYGGWIESIPAKLPRRQNPHMHLFEAILAMYECTGIDRYRIYAERLVKLFKDRFMHVGTPLRMMEFFDDDWKPNQVKGHIIEPGHMFEWCWLLSWYEELQKKKMSFDINDFFGESVMIGYMSNPPRIVNSVDWHGRHIDGGARYWPQTESAKSALALTRHGVCDALDLANPILNTILETYIGDYAPVRGGWIDELDQNGKPTGIYNSASAFYHFIGVASEIEDLLASPQAKSSITNST